MPRERVVARVIGWCATHRGAVVVLSVLLFAASVLAISRTPVDAIPDLTDRQVILFSEWMGRSPDLVEDQITYPLTTVMLGTPHVKAVRGQSMYGMSFVYVVFEDGTDLYWARQRVAEKLATLASTLPEGATLRMGPDASGVGWIYQYALVDRTHRRTLGELRAVQDYTLRYALSSVDGVAEVAPVGGYEREVQVTVDPDALRARGLTVADLGRAIRDANGDVGAGSIDVAGRELVVRGRGYLRTSEEIAQVVVRPGVGGSAIRVSDVASVTMGAVPRRGIADLDGRGEAVGGIVVARDGANARDVIARVKARLVELRGSLPSGVEIVPVYDRSGLIDGAIGTLRSALIEEMIVVGLVILLFLLHFRSSLLPIVVLPVSVAAAFIPMYFIGVSSNLMSLGGIAIAIGAMVDATIVIVENAHKRLEALEPGDDRTAALVASAKEVGPTIFFALSIITVSFLPIFGLTGQSGKLFHPLAWTKTLAMASSALLAVTLGPALLAWLVRGKIRHERNHPVSRTLIAAYKPFVHVALRNPKTTMLIGLFAVVSAVPLVPRIGSEFMPPLDEGDFLYMPTTMPGIAPSEAARALELQDRALRAFPEVRTVYGKIGRADTATDPAPLDMVETVVQLEPRTKWRRVHQDRWWSSWAPAFLAPALRAVWSDDRPKTSAELGAELAAAAQLPGWTHAGMTMPIRTRIDMLTTGVRSPVGVKILGDDRESVERLGTALEVALARVPGTQSVFAERLSGASYLDVIPRREELARLGLDNGDVLAALEAAVGGERATVLFDDRERIGVRVRYPREERLSVDAIENVLVPVPGPSAAADAPAAPTAMLATARPGRSARLAALLAPPLTQTMAGMGGGSGGSSSGSTPSSGGGAGPSVPGRSLLAGGGASGGMAGGGAAFGALGTRAPGGLGQAIGASGSAVPPASGGGLAQIRLGDVADVRIVEGPPMIKSENGRLAGYVFVYVDEARYDLGGWVEAAKRIVASDVRLSPGTELHWTGQYEQLTETWERMKLLVPLTLVLVLLLLWAHLRNVTEVAIVFLSVPFALIGSVWALWLLDYRFSAAVGVGLIALVGLAAQTGLVMVMYLDHAFERRKAAGLIRSLDDIIAAHEEGTVQRVRPKVMTVATTLIGLLPLLWAQGPGADVMKRIAAPMVGGLFTSLFLTLELIPVVYTYWRYAQLRREQRAAARAPATAQK